MAAEQAPITIFIGSSSEGEEIAQHLQVALRSDGWKLKVWNQGVFQLGSSSLQSLVEATKQYSFAILILTPDDRVERRGEVFATPRDNVIFELGLFTGAFGPERTIAVQCASNKLRLPTDLLGITTALYDEATDDDLAIAIMPAVLTIRKAIRERAPRLVSVATVPVGGVAPGPSPNLTRDLIDLLKQVANNRAGLGRQVTDEGDFKRWSGTLLNILRMQFRVRQSDAYTIWLRPNAEGRLRVYAADHLTGPQEHYDFAIGEGLAGRVWETGNPAAHSVREPHPDWVTRPNCENTTYLCVPVGSRGGAGGVLSVGSDSGFSVVLGQDIRLLELFAWLLAFAVT